MKTNLLKMLFSSKTTEVQGIVKSIGTTLDNLITSDEERKELQVQLERLSSLHQSPFVAGGRSAIMYALSLILIYQAVFRDWLAMKYGVDNLPPAAFDLTDLIEQALALLAGVL